jgi:nucleoside-diphosphate-sugar epimerase
MRSVTILGSGRSIIAPPLIDLLSKRYDNINCNAEMIATGADVISLLPMPLLPARLLALRDAKRLVVLSSTWVHTRAHEPIGLEVARAENEVFRCCTAAGIPWTILRPTMMYRPPYDPNITALARFIRHYRVMPLAGFAAGLRQPVHGDDIAHAIVEAMQSDAAVNRAFDLPGGETVRFRDIVVRIFRALRRVPIMVPMPSPWLSKIAPRKWHHTVATMNKDMVFDRNQAFAAFGYQPRPFNPQFPSDF